MVKRSMATTSFDSNSHFHGAYLNNIPHLPFIDVYLNQASTISRLAFPTSWSKWVLPCSLVVSSTRTPLHLKQRYGLCTARILPSRGMCWR
jgi:hypothetical protein